VQKVLTAEGRSLVTFETGAGGSDDGSEA
jgi:hypothetical protein